MDSLPRSSAKRTIIVAGRRSGYQRNDSSESKSVSPSHRVTRQAMSPPAARKSSPASISRDHRLPSQEGFTFSWTTIGEPCLLRLVTISILSRSRSLSTRLAFQCTSNLSPKQSSGFARSSA